MEKSGSKFGSNKISLENWGTAPPTNQLDTFDPTSIVTISDEAFQNQLNINSKYVNLSVTFVNLFNQIPGRSMSLLYSYLIIRNLPEKKVYSPLNQQHTND